MVAYIKHDCVELTSLPPQETVLVRDIKFAHCSIKPRFDDGKSLAMLIRQIRNSEVDPLRDRFLFLKVWHFRGGLIARNNSRLYCFMEFQKHRAEDVMVNVHIVKLGKIVEKFVRSCATRNGGESVRVRSGGRNNASRTRKLRYQSSGSGHRP